MATKNLAAYCRVSTERQRDEQTIEVQKSIIKEWAAKNNAIIVGWYIDDGWSGELLARPDLDHLRDDADKGIWEAVIIVDRDRLARKLSLQELVIDELVEKEIGVIFLNEPLADNPEGRIMQQIKGVFAEYERAKIAERMRRGKIHKAKNGKLVGNSAPYGYRYIPKSASKDGYFKIYEPEAEIVRMIFKWVADDGFSMRQVVKELYKRQIPPPKKTSERWVKSSVERLLNRQDYIGTSYYNKTVSVIPKHPQNVGKYKKIKKSSRRLKPKEEWIAIPVPPIIDKELFFRAHQRLEENKIYNWRNKKYDYLLINKIFCKCGCRRVGDGVNGHHYYRCAQRIYKYPLPNKCSYEGVNAAILDSMVWYRLLTLLAKKELIKSQAQKWQQKQGKVINKSQEVQERLKTTSEKLTSEEKKLLQAYTSNLISFEQFKDSAQELKAKKEAIESQIQELADKSPDEEVNLDNFDDICDTLFHVLKYADAADKRKYIKKLIVSIYVGERSRAEVNGRIPLVTQVQNIQDVLISRDCGVAQCGEVHTF